MTPGNPLTVFLSIAPNGSAPSTSAIRPQYSDSDVEHTAMLASREDGSTGHLRAISEDVEDEYLESSIASTSAPKKSVLVNFADDGDISECISDFETTGCFSRNIPGANERIVWFVSRGSCPIPSPGEGASEYLRDGVLLIHQYGEGDTQVWMWQNRNWVVVREGYPHPDLTGYVFMMKDKGEPTWVKKGKGKGKARN